MAPEYGATCGFFPVTRSTIDYLTATGRDPARVELVEAYAKVQGIWGASPPIRTPSSPTPWTSTFPASCPRWPARSARRTAWC